MYISVENVKNNILFRGYSKDGSPIQKKVKYRPTMYRQTNDTSLTQGWESFDHNPVQPIKFNSIWETREWVKNNKNIKGQSIYGNMRFVNSFIYDVFGTNDVEYIENYINTTYFDIETESDQGFPDPDKAEQKIISIALKSSKSDTTYVWGLKDYTNNDPNISYHLCSDEEELLRYFVRHWSNINHCPDIISGWNIKYFDIPYLVNRMVRLFGMEYTSLLSPWKIIKPIEKKSDYGKTLNTYELVGITTLDYLELFKTLERSYSKMESYKLDYVASVVLGENKLNYDEYGSLHNLYNENHQKFIDYNIKDVHLCERLEDSLGLIGLCVTLGYMAFTNFKDALANNALIESIIFRELSMDKKAVPIKKEHEKSPYEGAYVKSPKPGLYHDVVSFDLNSQYPSIIMQYNISPETIIDGNVIDVSLEDMINQNIKGLDTTEKSYTANGQAFCTKRIGHFPKIIKKLFNNRIKIKSDMIEHKKKLENVAKSDTDIIKDLTRIIARLDNKQTAIKIVMNAIYGSTGSPYFLYFDPRLAEAITSTGQLVIKTSEKTINDYLSKELSKPDDYVIAIDTDSLYINLESLNKGSVDVIDTYCEDKLLPVINNTYQRMYEIFGGNKKEIGIKREVIAKKAIWTAKKRYILYVADDEGVRYRQPKIKVTGIEAIKSSTPEICREALRNIFAIIFKYDENTIKDCIDKFRQYFYSCTADQVAFPRGVNNIEKYYQPNEPNLCSLGTPIHVRASIVYNDFVKKKGLDKELELIKSGDKVKFCYLTLPNPTKQNVIAFPQFLPKELRLTEYVDHKTQFDKTFSKPIDPILSALGWSEKDNLNSILIDDNDK